MYSAVTSCDQILPSVTSCLHVCFMISVKLCFWIMIQNVSKMCPKFGHILDTFLQFFHIKWCVQNVSIICPKIWTHFGRILDPSFFMEKLNKCVQSLDTLWTYFGYILSFGHLMDIFWTHFGFGHILDILCTRFGHFSRISVQNVSEHTLFTSPENDTAKRGRKITRVVSAAQGWSLQKRETFSSGVVRSFGLHSHAAVSSTSSPNAKAFNRATTLRYNLKFYPPPALPLP